MIQFTREEAAALREKAKRQPWIVEELKKQTAQVFGRPVLVPQTGIANWGLYYYCPDDSVRLQFDLDKPHAHVCPVCGKTFTGEPYDSTWWGQVNRLNIDGAYNLARLWLVSGEQAYAEKARDILLEYAKYYKGYAVHGDIPYNGPGKANAQTLDEAIFIRTLCYAYDLIEETLTPEQRQTIRQGIFAPGAEFLREHRANQLHNHEVIIDSGIAVAALILGREDLIRFAVYEPYGILYQLERATLADGVWFEGSLAYHFYAMESFYAYEKFAIHTPHSQLNNPVYRRMNQVVVNLLQPDFTCPLLNDSMADHAELRDFHLFEFSYKVFGDEDLLKILRYSYRGRPRQNVEAFFYGVDELPEAGELTLEEYHDADGSGLTVWRGEEGRFLLVKHSPYGGEHDHYDRLGISYVAHGERIAPDLGTCGYGAFYHYEYFKNTGTHNTVMIGEENQPPANCRVLEYAHRDGVTVIDAAVDWAAPYVPLDSFTIVQWDEKSYAKVRMRRRLTIAGRYFIDLFWVDGVEDGRSIDWMMHFCGARDVPAGEEYVEHFSEKKPFKHFTQVARSQERGVVQSTYRVGRATARLWTLVQGGELYYAVGPDNPTVSDAAFVIHRQRGEKALFISVVESYEDAPAVRSVAMEPIPGGARVSVETQEGVAVYEIK